MSFAVVFGLAATLCIVRLLKGPTFADRMVSLDALTNIAIVYVVYTAVVSGVEMYLDFAIVLAMLSFVGTMAVAKYVRGE